MTTQLPDNPLQPIPALGQRSRNPLPSNQVPLSSEDVLRGQPAVEIEHNGQVYRLQTTRQGKLILTK